MCHAFWIVRRETKIKLVTRDKATVVESAKHLRERDTNVWVDREWTEVIEETILCILHHDKKYV